MDLRRFVRNIFNRDLAVQKPLSNKKIPERSFNLDSINTLSENEILQRDARDYNILMFAAETGNTEAVDSLIERFVDLDLEVDHKTAATIAIENGHHEIVLKLLKANAKIPENYQSETASEELKSFLELSSEMHKKVKETNEEILDLVKIFLTQKIESNPHLKYFYDRNNNSVLKTAIEYKKFEVYELLQKNLLILAPHESMDNIKKFLNEKERQKLKDINVKIANALGSKELMILLENCWFCRENDDDYFDFIQKAFKFLFKIPEVAKFLNIVAARRDFKIIFDFNRDSVTFLDPNQEPFTNGICYLSGNIFIAAKDMLDPEKFLEVYSVIAHELCHFAMFLVFNNFAKPYSVKNNEDEMKFDLISRECEEKKNDQEIVSLVFDDYDEDMHHAELIVRVPQMIVAFKNEENLLSKMRQIYPKLFDFYETNVMSEMERELPKLKKKFCPLQKSEDKLNYFLTFVVIAVIAGLIYSFFLKSEPPKTNLVDKTLKFHGVDVKFHDIFGDNIVVYENVSSDQSKTKNLDLTDLVKEDRYRYRVFLKWENMTNDLKNQFLTLNVNFQGEFVAFNEILTKSSVLNCLTTLEILEILEGNLIKISIEPEFNQNFYIDRFFIYDEIKVDENHYENDKINRNHPDVKSIEEIVAKTSNFLLSNNVGEGKSTTFRNLALKLKAKFPKRWIQIVDVKKYFEIDKNIKYNKIPTNDLLSLNKLETEIFYDFLYSDRVIILWDGIDEISSDHRSFVLRFIKDIETSSNSLQIISTWPQNLNDYKEFNFKALKLISFGKSERFEFLVKFIASEKLNLNADQYWEVFNSKNVDNESLKEKIVKLVDGCENFLNSIEDEKLQNKFFANPLWIQNTAKIFIQASVDEILSFNSFSIFDRLIDKHFEIYQKKCDISKLSNENVNHIHQHYALKLISRDILNFYIDLNFSENQISCYEILYLNSKNELSFVHQTFAEFFVAKFMVDGFEKNNDEEKLKKIKLISLILYSAEFDVLKNFLLNLSETENKNLEIFKLFKTIKELKSLAKNERILKLLKFSTIKKYLASNYNLRVEKFLKFNFSEWSREDFNYLNTKIELFSNYFGSERFLEILIEKDSNEQTIFHKVSQFSEVFEVFLKSSQKLLFNKKIAPLFFIQDRSRKTSLMMAASKSNSHSLKLFWKIIDENLDKIQKKEILLLENAGFRTALQYSMINDDSNSFNFVAKLYDEIFTPDEIKNILWKNNPKFPFIIFNVIKLASYETALEVSNYLESFFNVNQLDIIVGKIDCSWFQNRNEEFEKKLKIFSQKFKIFEKENCENESFLKKVFGALVAFALPLVFFL